MKLILVIVLMFIALSVNAEDTLKFNGTKIKLTEQSKYPNAKFYTDESGNQYITATLLVTKEGVLIGESGSPFEKWFMFPTDKINLNVQDIEDIFLFIKSRDLKNRLK